MKINLIVNCAGLLIFTSCAVSFAAVTGRISGTVTDPTGSAIPGATITISNTAQGLETKTTTDAQGNYSFPSVNVGTYDILFEATGFRSEKRTGLAVDANAAIEGRFNVARLQSTGENLRGAFVKKIERGIAGRRRHWSCSFSQVASAFCISDRQPVKK